MRIESKIVKCPVCGKAYNANGWIDASQTVAECECIWCEYDCSVKCDVITNNRAIIMNIIGDDSDE